MTTDGIETFINARLDEDEQRYAQWPEVLPPSPDGQPWRDTDGHVIYEPRSRMLDEVKAKRQLLQQFVLRGNAVRATVAPSSGGVWDDLLRMLVIPYAGHPDCPPEWRP